MTIVARLPRKKYIVSGSSDETTVPLAGGSVTVDIEFPEISRVLTLQSVAVDTNPAVEVSIPENVSYDGNKLSMTLVFAAGTTMRANATVIGE